MNTKANQTSTNKSSSLSLHELKTQSDDSKAALFNLIVYTHEERRTAYFKELVKLIKTQFPCRIFFIKGNPSAKQAYFRAQASSENNSDGSGFKCDQFFFEAAGNDLNRVYFLLLPLFVPDLPIYLLWGQDPGMENSILPHLEHFATRLIFDAEATEDLQQFSREMLNRMNVKDIDIIDMNWARIGGWREVIAQTFDSPERVNQLASANLIELIYNSCPSSLFFFPEIQSVYLQAWISARLNWKFIRAEKEETSQVLYYEAEEKIRKILLTPQSDKKFEAEEILGIEIKGELGYECHMKRLSLDQIKIQASNQFQCELPFVLLMPTLRSGRSFMQEIFYQKPSNQYKQTLQYIGMVQWS